MDPLLDLFSTPSTIYLKNLIYFVLA